MGRKRKGSPVHGWIALDKPRGLSSSKAVGRVRYLLNAQKAGHGGTLDPEATGLLPIALGEATKTVSYVMDGEKTYRFTLKFGAETNTGDVEGETIRTSDVRPDEETLKHTLAVFTGEIEQIPPAFSAIKINGERAYKLARRGEVVDMPARKVRIHAIDMIGRPDSDTAEFEVRCAKGTYIRALARDIAAHAGSAGHLTALRRTKCGPFGEKDAISLENLESMGHSALDRILPVRTALDDIPALALTGGEADGLAHGTPVSLLAVAKRVEKGVIAPGRLFCAIHGERPVALVRAEGGKLRPVRVFNF